MPDNFSELLNLNHEMRALEYKAGAPFDLIRPQVTKAILAMSNIRDGGSIIIGLAERSNEAGYDRVGLTEADIATYDAEDIQDFVAQYADPPCEFQVRRVEHEGVTFLWIVVAEFREVPIICRRDWHDRADRGGPPFFRRGALYTRALAGRPRTVEVSSVEELREILDLAHLKRARRFIQEAEAAGLIVRGLAPPQPADVDLFRRQLDELEA